MARVPRPRWGVCEQRHPPRGRVSVDGRWERDGETNPWEAEWADTVKLVLRPVRAGRAPRPEQKRFSVADRKGVLRVIASPDWRHSSLRLQQDAVIHSSVLEGGHHLMFELRPSRRVWLHVVPGELTVGDVALGAGDGFAVAISFTARVARRGERARSSRRRLEGRASLGLVRPGRR